ncbi:MAG: hypothetical protein ACOY4R_12055 [Pseudomonadota bacterium]
MASGLHTLLTPEDEILLRRVALGSQGLDTKKLARLSSLALVERAGNGWRLTPLGRHRFDSLPKALVFQKRRLPLRLALEATLEKYRQRAPVESKAAGGPADTPPGAAPQAPILLDAMEWKQRAERYLLGVRDQMGVHLRRQTELVEESEHCITVSRRLLKASVPRLPIGVLLASTGGASAREVFARGPGDR